MRGKWIVGGLLVFGLLCGSGCGTSDVGEINRPVAPTSAATILRFMKGNRAIVCYKYRHFPLGGMVYWERVQCPRNDQIRSYGMTYGQENCDTCLVSSLYEETSGAWLVVTDKQYTEVPIELQDERPSENEGLQ